MDGRATRHTNPTSTSREAPFWVKGLAGPIQNAKLSQNRRELCRCGTQGWKSGGPNATNTLCNLVCTTVAFRSPEVNPQHGAAESLLRRSEAQCHREFPCLCRRCLTLRAAQALQECQDSTHRSCLGVTQVAPSCVFISTFIHWQRVSRLLAPSLSAAALRGRDTGAL